MINATNQISRKQTQPIEVVDPNPSSPIANPAAWMHSGSSPAEVITAAAFFLGALTGLLQTLLPYLRQRTNKKIK
jgi:hypothetical protein